MQLQPRKQAATSSSMQQLREPVGMPMGDAALLLLLLLLMLDLLLVFLQVLATLLALLLPLVGLLGTTLRVGVTTLGR
jgi:hypothetical protein